MKNMLGLIFLGLLCPTLTRSTLLHAGPIGIVMCKRLCKTSFGCKSYTYVPLYYTCYNGESKTVTVYQAINVKIQEPWLFTGITNTTCMSSSRIIFSRSKKPVCLERRNMQDTKEDVKKTDQFKYHAKDLSFDNARIQCKKEGGSLAQFSKGFPEDTLKQIYIATKYDCAWIDLTYHKELKQFKWGDGTPYLEEDRWYGNEPTHVLFSFAEENCVCMKKTLLLQDITCITRLDFICEMPI